MFTIMMWCSGGKRKQKGKEGRIIMIILRSRVVKSSVSLFNIDETGWFMFMFLLFILLHSCICHFVQVEAR